MRELSLKSSLCVVEHVLHSQGSEDADSSLSSAHSMKQDCFNPATAPFSSSVLFICNYLISPLREKAYGLCGNVPPPLLGVGNGYQQRKFFKFLYSDKCGHRKLPACPLMLQDTLAYRTLTRLPWNPPNICNDFLHLSLRGGAERRLPVLTSLFSELLIAFSFWVLVGTKVSRS